MKYFNIPPKTFLRHQKKKCLRFLVVPFIASIFFSCPLQLSAASDPHGLWEEISVNNLAARSTEQAWIRPKKAQTLTLNFMALKSLLNTSARRTGVIHSTISLPVGNGDYAVFIAEEYNVMGTGLAEKYPEIKTYKVREVNGSATGCIDITPQGFHGMLYTDIGHIYIDPYSRNNTSLYSCYTSRDYKSKEMRPSAFRCDVKGDVSLDSVHLSRSHVLAKTTTGNIFRSYRLACAATGEYTAYHGGTKVLGQAAIVTAINRVNQVYEKDLAIRLVLVANNDDLVYTDAGTDPYSNEIANALLTENQSNIDSVIGIGNYDIGHVLGTGGGGLAELGVVCISSLKAKGETGDSEPKNDPFWIDYIAHEIGHQFGANHTFNGIDGSCNGFNRNAFTAYEPGSASTIMGYTGICASDNIQAHSDDYFHAVSIQEIMAFVTGSASCFQSIAISNTPPVANAGSNYTIPARTPFILTGSASDVDGDNLSYCWEEWDLGIAQALSAGDIGSGPLFRSFPPNSSNYRYFPRLSSILSNSSTMDEDLPTTTRGMNFRLTVRDNHLPAGGTDSDDMQVSVSSAAGPFQVTSPNTAVSWSGNQTITWNVAGTTGNGINAANVDIYLSTDSGQTFPVLLSASTPNDGSQTINLPNISSSTARIKVQGSGNIFFDISNTDFSITPIIGPGSAFFIKTGSYAISDNAGTGNNNGVIDPGETMVQLTLNIKNSGSTNASSVVGTLSAISPNITIEYGTSTFPDMAVGASAANQQTFIISIGSAHPCGDYIKLALRVASAQGTNTINFALSTGTTTPKTFSYNAHTGNDPAISIPDNNTNGVNASIPVSGLNGNISKLIFSIDGQSCSGIEDDTNNGLTHTYVGDLILKLTSPIGTTITLMSNPGQNPDDAKGNNFCNVFLDDSAVTNIESIPTDNGPYTGSYQPSQALSTFNGESPNGNWTVNFQDTYPYDVGSFRAFSLHFTLICEAPATTSNDDIDNDGLPNDWERKFSGNMTSANANVDIDGDGHNNLQEYIADTDPNNLLSVLTLGITRQGQPLYDTVNFMGSTNRSYDLQVKTNLWNTSWSTLQPNMPGSNVIQYIQTPANGIRKFYRIKVNNPTP